MHGAWQGMACAIMHRGQPVAGHGRISAPARHTHSGTTQAIVKNAQNEPGCSGLWKGMIA
jgi:hypothetical protein